MNLLIYLSGILTSLKKFTVTLFRRKNRTLLFFAISFIIIASFAPSLPQDPDDDLKNKLKQFEKRQKQLKIAIENTEKLIKETKAKESQSEHQLLIYKEQIKERETLIASLNSEAQILNNFILEKQSIVEALENDLKALKKEYAQMLISAYRNKKSYSNLLFLFSAKNFRDLFKRYRFLDRYSEYRKNQAFLINETNKNITKKLDELKLKKKEKDNKLSELNAQKRTLRNESSRINNLLSKLKSKKRNLGSKLEEQKKTARETERMIRKIIKEIETSNNRLSKIFANNRGKLPWPLNNKGTITKRYGIYTDAVYGTKQKINGIHIATTKGTSATAIFEGKVISIFSIPGAQQSVIISHGKYFSVYQHLVDVNVEPGNDVKTGQKLGKIFTYEDEGKTEMVFELWNKDTNAPLNPEKWLRK